MHILLVDNYDSFTYNLAHYLAGLGVEVTVARNDALPDNIDDGYTHLVLSPGPGLPAEAGKLMALIAEYAAKKPILGICLGMQALAIHFGGRLYNQPTVKHGLTTTLQPELNDRLYKNIPPPITVGLYHSWAVNKDDLPAELQATATSAEGVLMSFKHKKLPIYGVQFHPESILTPFGKLMLKNWVGGEK